MNVLPISGEQVVGQATVGVADNAASVNAPALGLDAFIAKTDLATVTLDNAIRLAIQQRVGEAATLDSQIQRIASALPSPLPSSSKPQELADSADAMWSDELDVTLLPIIGTNLINASNFFSGQAIINEFGRLRIATESGELVRPGRFIASFVGPANARSHAFVTVDNVTTCEDGYIVEAMIAEGDDDLLNDALLAPRWNPRTARYELGLPADTIEALCSLGVLTPYLFDRVIVCPDCHATPTLRLGCRSCGSADTTNRQLIHHYACAHVDEVAEYEDDDGLVCPKCRVRQLVIGADYESLEGPHECLSCGWSDNDLEMVAQCHACDLRFALEFALEEELIAYHVERLDPLAIIAAS